MSRWLSSSRLQAGSSLRNAYRHSLASSAAPMACIWSTMGQRCPPSLRAPSSSAERCCSVGCNRRPSLCSPNRSDHRRGAGYAGSGVAARAAPYERPDALDSPACLRDQRHEHVPASSRHHQHKHPLGNSSLQSQRPLPNHLCSRCRFHRAAASTSVQNSSSASLSPVPSDAGTTR
jgi:hypothetical protein